MSDMEWVERYERHMRTILGDQHPDVIFERRLAFLKNELDQLGKNKDT